MPLRLRFLLDTNVLIPLQDSFAVLGPNLAGFVRLAGVGGHQLLYHPASVEDIKRDRDAERRQRTLTRLKQYTSLQKGPACPWNTRRTSINDACDNEILYALESDAVHALVTEDQKLHAKARARGLGDRVYYIQTAEDWLRRLHEQTTVVLPRIEDVELHTLSASLNEPFFDSVKDGYPGFESWFRDKAKEGRRAWIYRSDQDDRLSAICIYAIQNDQVVTDSNYRLEGKALKLCTFKVGEEVRGRKIGELFLRAAFRFASDQECESIFLHADPIRHDQLINLLSDFGFSDVGAYKSDRMYVKSHPVQAPALRIDAFEYIRKYYPHYMSGDEVQKFLVPIKPEYHQILFPDCAHPGVSLPVDHPRTHVGNAIKLAYLSHSPTNQPKEGDIVLFYRTHDSMAITTLGVVERYSVSSSPADIARMVSRRTVYSEQEIVAMAKKSPTKVMLFRLVTHIKLPVSYAVLRSMRVVSGPIQSIKKIDDDAFSRILAAAQR